MTSRNAWTRHLRIIAGMCVMYAMTGAAAPVAERAREGVPRAEPVAAPQTAAAPASAAKTYGLNARVFITGKAARQEGTVGTTQLKGTERDLTTYLTYRDYRLIEKGAATVSTNEPLTLKLSDNASAAVTVISSVRDLIKVQIVWKVPGQQELNTKLNVVRNRATMIGGPRHAAGGIYLLSLTVK